MLTSACFNHPDRPAVEHCEVCRRPVCGLCLWYAESGERLCPDHAAELSKAGKPVVPPDRYVAGIASSEASAASPSAAVVPYKGNSTDVGALIAAVVGVMALAACAGVVWVLPLLAFFLGLVNWLHANDALDPKRTRWLSGLGMAGGGIFVVSIIFFFAACFLCSFLPLFVASLSGSGGFPTPLPTATP